MPLDAARKALVTRQADREAGTALVLVLLVSLLLLALGLTAMWVSSSGVRVTANLARRQEALAAAEVGIERARSVLAGAGDWNPLLGDASSSVLCATSPVTPRDVKKGNILCDGGRPLKDIPVIESASSTTAAAPELASYKYTVWIRNDPVETAINSAEMGPFLDRDRQVILVAEGQGRDGLSYVAIEVTVMLSP